MDRFLLGLSVRDFAFWGLMELAIRGLDPEVALIGLGEVASLEVVGSEEATWNTEAGNPSSR